ncbi:MAG TPA: sulfotransferase domain-containing protein [Rhizomicrobium sp.]|nr:sulfotransferase domain-containing protein [Rhizomicrobium sp.]
MDTQAPRRAQTIAEFVPLIGRMFVDEERDRALAAYRPRPTDVIISPFGKCGTTWLQQTFHCLRTRGDMDFDDISRAVPWIETSVMLGIDINAEQKANPRGFKSHLGYDELPKGARYVVSLRDPKDALVSMYRFMEGWFIEPGTVAIGQFAFGWAMNARYWRHLKSWWAQRDNPDVLLFSYEHMCADPKSHVERLAKFCGIALDEKLLALTLDHSSIAFMLKHKDKFDDLLMRRKSEERCKLPPGSDSAKVRKGGIGGHHGILPPEAGAMLDQKWESEAAAATGFASYQELESALRKRSARRA